MRFATTIAAAGLAAAMLGAGAAQALPGAIAPGSMASSTMVQPALDTGPAPKLELIRGGCGFGEHRAYYGHCRYNHGWRGAIRYRRNHWRWRHRYYY